MEKEIKLTIGELNDIYQKYGDLGLKVETQYGFKDITWCGITEKNADVYRCELESGLYVEGADYHKIKNDKDEFINLINAKPGELIQTRFGLSPIKECYLMDIKDTLYDIQVDEVHEFYSNDIVSHNTTFSIDALKFLFFGTTSKTDKNEEIFNQYSDSNQVVVRGGIRIENDDYLIERKITRTPKRNGNGYTVRGSVSYSIITPDGEYEELKGEDGIKTTKKIKDTIGSEADFELMVLATSDNLTDLISSLPTTRGKLLTKFIGLDPIEKKERVVRDMYNKFVKTMKANHYDITTLTTDINDLKSEIESINIVNERLAIELSENEAEVDKHNKTRDKLLASKHNIDDKILSIDKDKLSDEIEGLISEGIEAKKSVDFGNVEIEKIKDIVYDEELDFNLNKERNELKINVGKLENEVATLETENINLKNSEICPTCGQPLKDVDNSETISNNIKTIEVTKTTINELTDRINEIDTKLLSMSEDKQTVNKRDKLELTRDRLEVKMGGLRNKITEKRAQLKEYNLNISIIESNKQLESQIVWEDTEIAKLMVRQNSINDSINQNNNRLSNINTDINEKEVLIEEITKEDKIEKVYKTYIELVGKKGISKLILRSVLPIINSELHRLLSETCNFDVELDINDKNDVEFNIILDDVTKPLKSGSGFEKTASAIALRAVLGRITTLATPNFITFDEVFGKVANINLDYIELLFQKMNEMYDKIFIITHNKIVADWSDNILTVIKTGNISKLTVK